MCFAKLPRKSTVPLGRASVAGQTVLNQGEIRWCSPELSSPQALQWISTLATHFRHTFHKPYLEYRSCSIHGLSYQLLSLLSKVFLQILPNVSQQRYTLSQAFFPSKRDILKAKPAPPPKELGIFSKGETQRGSMFAGKGTGNAGHCSTTPPPP